MPIGGDGQVNVWVEAFTGLGRLGGYLRADGHVSPSNGASFDNVGGGVRDNILPRSLGGRSTVDRLVSNHDRHPPDHIEGKFLTGQERRDNLKAYNAAIASR